MRVAAVKGLVDRLMGSRLRGNDDGLRLRGSRLNNLVRTTLFSTPVMRVTAMCCGQRPVLLPHPFIVVPAKAGTHAELEISTGFWIPAFAHCCPE
jgi:hypothetical protein